ncbi:class F sortase [Microbacterium excoecariae]|uniref:class F sortase n=1 Tax=Microbacterium excoecariae TaxID=2715210 RepID=UPI00140A22CD|nr:class F sortase [Microbacterium excoecariae]NHI16078.1 class F sortase [Microbacterium excoecariae]
MMTARRILAASAAVTALGLVATACAGPGSETSAPVDAAGSSTVAATDFLDTYVDGGRVVRTDQGGDTVSEGQAYGLLLALAADDETRFDEIWTWTTENIQRDDLLLSWRWADGAVVDAEPASDADLDAARALVLAGDAFGRDDLREDGLDLGDAVLDRMTARTALGRVLLPGPWASASPHRYNPSYASPVAYAVLGEASGDERWEELADGSRAVTSALLDANALPTNWATVAQDGSVAIAGGADGQGEPEYGYDAARTPIRFAESCDDDDVAIAARIAAGLPSDEVLPAELDSGGGSITSDQHPVAYAGRAAAYAADGRGDAAKADLTRMGETADETPTYYGDAWEALAEVMLAGDVLGGCPPTTGGSSEAASAGAAPSTSSAGGLQDPVASEEASGAVPLRVSIPAIGIASDLISLGRGADGWIEAPADYDDIGWYKDGVVPGDVGPAVIAAHVDSPWAAAVFHELGNLVPGDTVSVERSDGTTAEFVVTGIQNVKKHSFPTEQIYAPTPTPELRLVTCGGPFSSETGRYEDNVVVTAVAA